MWKEITPSEFPHERDALNFIRARLPEREPFRAFSNFTFQAEDGRRYEIDLLVITPRQVWLVEIKSFHVGVLRGDPGTWTQVRSNGARRTFDNPIHLADSKAKKLKSLLLRQPALRGVDTRPLYIQAVIFITGDATIDLDDAGRTDVYGKGPTEDQPRRAGVLPPIMDTLTAVPAGDRRRIDRPLSARIATALDEAGIRQSVSLRRAGHYSLTELIDEGDVWQDFVAQNPHSSLAKRRVRLYLASAAATDEEREQLNRAAKREYELLDGLDVLGVERPLELFRNPQGHALVYNYDNGARRIDHWLADHKDNLELDARLDLLRALGETVSAVHRQGLYHRSLSPQHIYVSGEPGGEITPKIRDWGTATRQVSTTGTALTSTVHVGPLTPDAEQLYIAPEVLSVPNASPLTADIFSLGALAILILSGGPPAPDIHGVQQMLREHGSLSLTAVLDGADQELENLVTRATAAVATERYTSVQEFLEYLDNALEVMTRPPVVSPFDASKGTVIGEWRITRRIGTGATAVVLEATRGNSTTPSVLKVARPDKTERIQAEAEALRRLTHPAIINDLGFTELSGHAALILERAERSLAQELTENGPLTLDRLERFGTDLLDALVYLESEGVAHRDIKPDNLGVVLRTKNDERHLALLDFSLSNADRSDVKAGTMAYVDPFLNERETKKWDEYAERFAAGVTLHELATGERPTWGDGSTDPALLDDRVPNLRVDRVDPVLAEPLGEFLTRTLHRDLTERFSSAQEMRRAWGRVFSGTDTADTARDDGVDVEDLDLAGVGRGTPIADLGLSAKVHNAIDRLGVGTAGELAGVPVLGLTAMSGTGALVRHRVARLAERLRDHLPQADEIGPTAGRDSIDSLVDGLVPKPPADEAHRRATKAFLALDVEDAPPWPRTQWAAKRAELTSEDMTAVLVTRHNQWQRSPELTKVRSDLVQLLEDRGGVATGDELAEALSGLRGSMLQGSERLRAARAVVRAALEGERVREAPRFDELRIRELLVVALNGEIGRSADARAWDAEVLHEVALLLGEKADALLTNTEIISPQRTLMELRSEKLPAAAPTLSDARLVRLAAACSDTAAASSRLELYRRGMDAVTALRASRAALLSRRALNAEQLVQRVRTRFPQAQELPEPPQLDALLREAETGLQPEQRDGARVYVLPEMGGQLRTSHLSSSSVTRYETHDDRDAAVAEIDERLQRLSRDGGFLVLTAGHRQFSAARDRLVAASGSTHVDIDQLLISHMRTQADEVGAVWDVVVAADTDPTGRPFSLLRQLVSRAVPGVVEELRSAGPTVVATGIGLLARYSQMTLLEQLRDELTRGTPQGALRGMVVLVPGQHAAQGPMIDGTPIPTITAGQRGHVPSAWIDAAAA